MAHYAELDSNNIVVRVLVVDNAVIDGQAFLNDLFGTTSTWLQTSYNTRGGVHYGPDGNPDGGVALRKNYAGTGFTYDPVKDAFIPPQPFPSWLFDEFPCNWNPPVPYPTDGKFYVWNEDIKNWTSRSI